MPSKNRYLFFDTETNGLPGKTGRNREKTSRDRKLGYWPRVVQLAWILTDAQGTIYSESNFLIRPDGWDIGPSAQRCHGISTEKAAKEGISINKAIQRFALDLWQVDSIVAHNIDFDVPVLAAEFKRLEQGNPLKKISSQCTMKIGGKFLANRPADPSDSPLHLKSRKGRKVMPPSLSRLYAALHGKEFDGAHDALVDARACMECFLK